MRSILIGAAAIALAAGTAFADPGKGQGGGNKGNGGGKPSAAGTMNGGGEKSRGKDARADDLRGHDMRGHDMGEQGKKAEKAARRERLDDDRDDRGKDARKADRREDRRVDRDDRKVDRDVRIVDRDGRRGDEFDRFDRDGRGLIAGCPPGLAKKNNGCMPPGLAKKGDNWRDGSLRPEWFGYSSLGDGRYFQDDGYLYRLNDRGSVMGFVPLLGGALSVGNQWPSFYRAAPVDDYYVQYYNLGAPGSYRYADDVLYRVDPQTSAITSIAALLTGDQFAVGQPMPMGYDVYNVPYAYRDRYADGPDANYRYADGQIYEVDPTTQLIAAVIELLV